MFWVLQSFLCAWWRCQLPALREIWSDLTPHSLSEHCVDSSPTCSSDTQYKSWGFSAVLWCSLSYPNPSYPVLSERILTGLGMVVLACNPSTLGTQGWRQKDNKTFILRPPVCGDWIQGPVQARHVLYHQAIPSVGILTLKYLKSVQSVSQFKLFLWGYYSKLTVTMASSPQAPMATGIFT
jgi:hypothetical protein